MDIFPEMVPETASRNLWLVEIRHLLSMSSGVAYENPVGPDWIRTYFSLEFPHEPRTDFLYNNAPATLLAAIIERRSGQKLEDYLKTRLFDKIGIDSGNIRWFRAPDGTTFAPGGLHCTTEDLLRLMLLYKNGGVWEGERILPREYVQEATKAQISTAHIFGSGYVKEGKTRISDNAYGYGYMMWMSRFPGVYRAEGANGQFGIVFPEKDMIIAITQSCPESPVSQTTLDYVWEFIGQISIDEAIAPSLDFKRLQNRLTRLVIPAEPFEPYGTIPFPGQWYQATGRGAHPESLFYDPIVLSREAERITGITAFSFEPAADGHAVRMAAIINDTEYHLQIPTNGSRILEKIPEIYLELVALSGYWKDPNQFAVRFRWMESVFVSELIFTFQEEVCTVSVKPLHGDFPRLTESVEFILQKV